MAEEKKMTLERLQEILDAFGADPDRWPEAERAAAEELLSMSAAAQAKRDEAARLDELLLLAPETEPSTSLQERILAARPRPSPGLAGAPGSPEPGGWRAAWAALWPYGSPLAPTVTLAACMALGLYLGTTGFIERVGPFNGSVITAEDAEFLQLAFADFDGEETWQ